MVNTDKLSHEMKVFYQEYQEECTKMSSYDEWYEAISSGDPIKKRNLMYKRMDEMRASSKVSPEQTEEFLAIYERTSLRNFEQSERERKEHEDKLDDIHSARGFPQNIADWIICISSTIFVILAYIASR